MVHIIDLSHEGKYIFCDDKLLPLKGMALVETSNNPSYPLISHPIVGEGWETVGFEHYETLHPGITDLDDFILGRLGEKVDIRSVPIWKALSYSLTHKMRFSAAEILVQATKYGFQFDNSKCPAGIRLKASYSSSEDIYVLTCCDNETDTVLCYPVPDIYLTLGKTRYSADLETTVFSIEYVCELLVSALCDYSDFFDITGRFELMINKDDNLDPKGNAAISKLKNAVNKDFNKLWR